MKLVVLILVLFSVHSYAESLAVGVQRVGVRAKASILKKPNFFLKYGDLVTVTQKKGKWSQISYQKKSGWVRSSSLGVKKSILRDIGKSEAEVAKDYQDEVASAAKGFSAEMEALHKKDNPKLNFADVDKLEKNEISESALIRFAKQGKLKSDQF